MVCTILFEPYQADFIQQQRKDNGRGKAYGQAKQADSKGVFQYGEKLLVFEKVDKMRESDPWSRPDGPDDIIFLKGDDNPHKRDIAKDNHPENPRKGHSLKIPLGIKSF